MAHSALHFTLGAALGTAWTGPALLRAWRAGKPLAARFRRWLLLSYALGAFAVVPSLLGWLGVPAAVCRHGLMNVFLFHPLLTRLRSGGLIPAAGAVILWFLVPYALLVAAILRARREDCRGTKPIGDGA